MLLKMQEGDSQIIQGVVDCLFLEEDGKWVLLDYKTDRVQHLLSDDESLLTKEMTNRYEYNYPFMHKQLNPLCK